MRNKGRALGSITGRDRLALPSKIVLGNFAGIVIVKYDVSRKKLGSKKAGKNAAPAPQRVRMAHHKKYADIGLSRSAVSDQGRRL